MSIFIETFRLLVYLTRQAILSIIDQVTISVSVSAFKILMKLNYFFNL